MRRTSESSDTAGEVFGSRPDLGVLIGRIEYADAPKVKPLGPTIGTENPDDTQEALLPRHRSRRKYRGAWGMVVFLFRRNEPMQAIRPQPRSLDRCLYTPCRGWCCPPRRVQGRSGSCRWMSRKKRTLACMQAGTPIFRAKCNRRAVKMLCGDRGVGHIDQRSVVASTFFLRYRRDGGRGGDDIDPFYRMECIGNLLPFMANTQ